MIKTKSCDINIVSCLVAGTNYVWLALFACYNLMFHLGFPVLAASPFVLTTLDKPKPETKEGII